MKLKIEIILPIWLDEDDWIEDSEIVLNELLSLSNSTYLPLDEFDCGKLSFSVLTSITNKSLLKTCPWLIEFGDKKYLKVDSTIEYNPDDYDGIEPTILKYITKEEFLNTLCTSIFKDRFLNFLTFINIAKPGFLATRKGVILKNWKYYLDVDQIISPVCPAYIFRKTNWPPLMDLPIEKVWTYILTKTKILTERSNSNTEKAFNSFSYLFDDRSNLPSQLFWALSGIEAIYAEGEIGISYQIDKKVQLFLGEIKSGKKRLKKMYDFRSRLIHGDLNIPINNGWMEQQEFEDDLLNEVTFASMVLTSTLQKIISEDRMTLNFNFTY